VKTSIGEEAVLRRVHQRSAVFPGATNKRVLFIGGNYYPEPTGIGKYNGEMIDQLAANGYHCTVITSFPYYPHWKIQAPYSGRAYWYKKEIRENSDVPGKVEIYRCPQYVPNRPSGPGRILLDLTFFLTSFLKVLHLLFQKRYDYVITVVPCFPIGLHGILYKKIKKARFIYHVQDLQIDAAKELRLIKSNSVINLLLRVERYILKRADIVSSISEGMITKIKEKCSRDVVLFPNWVDTNAFYPLPDKDRLKSKFDISPSDKVILYSGAIGEKQGLEILIQAALKLKNVSGLKFVICGSGPYKDQLINMVNELQLNNVLFFGTQPYQLLNQFLNLADVHLVLQKAIANDLVMPSKLTTILSIGGLSIVTAKPGSSLYELVSAKKLALLIEPDNPLELVKAIKSVLHKNHNEIKANARLYASEHLSTDKVLSGYLKHMQ
jgi:colanic acid biosynthesis glycosyl transferase WcaI